MMNVRSSVGLIALAVIVIVIGWFLSRADPGGPAGEDGPGSAGTTLRPSVPAGEPYIPDTGVPLREGSRVPVAAPESPLEIPRMIALAETLNDPDASVEDDLAVIDAILQHYRRSLRRMPAGGLNEEIVAGLRGRNERRLVYIGPDNARLNENGELLDRFGEPYYFHPVSDQLIEVRSRGADRTLWTDDDVVLEGARDGGTRDGQ